MEEIGWFFMCWCCSRRCGEAPRVQCKRTLQRSGQSQRTTFHIAERHAQLGARSEPLSEWCDSKDEERGSLEEKLEDGQRNRRADAEQRTECMKRPTHHELKSSCLVEQSMK